jgi:hypothetical protein
VRRSLLATVAAALLALAAAAPAPLVAIDLSAGGFLTAWSTAAGAINQPGPVVKLPPGAAGAAHLVLETKEAGNVVCGGWASAAFELSVAGKTVARGAGGGELVPDWLETRFPIRAGRTVLGIRVTGGAPRFVLRCSRIGVDGGRSDFKYSGVRTLVETRDARALVAGGLQLRLTRRLFAPRKPGVLFLEASYGYGSAAGGMDVSYYWSLTLRVSRGGKDVGGCTEPSGYGCFSLLALPAGSYDVVLTLSEGVDKTPVRTASFTVEHDPAAADAIAAAAAALDLSSEGDLDNHYLVEKLAPAAVHAWAALIEADRLYAPLQPDAGARVRALAAARLALARAERGDAALAAEHGLVPRGVVSRHDGLVQVWGLYLPPGKRSGAPLALGLHGAGSSGTDFCRKLLGGIDDAPGILACPDGYGPSAFLQAGGAEALDVLEAARALGPADPARIYVTGGSHGGVGTYALALQHPALFAAAAALSGSADLAVFPSIAGKPRAAHEDAWLRARAWRNWAANARNVAFEVVHGGKDSLVVAHATAFKDAMDALGLPLVYTVHPDLGHDVWTRTYAGGAIWKDFFDAHTKPAAPADVWLTTPGPPVRDAWAALERVDESVAPMDFATLRAHAGGGKIVVETKGAGAVRLAPPASLPGALIVDGVTVPRDAPCLWRRGGTWEPGPAPGPWREGPLDAVRARPLSFGVDGVRTLDMAYDDLDRLLAGMSLRYHIYASPDVVPSPELRKDHSVMLYGNPRHNRLLGEILAGSPIAVDDDGVTVAGVRYAGKDVGVRAILPSPWSARDYVVVSAGPTAAGVRCAVWLPEALPDWAVCTSAALVRPGGMILGAGRKLLGAGFWGRAFWRKAEGKD